MGTISGTLQSRGSRLALIGIAIFIVTIGVRLLYWQDNHTEIARGEPWMSGLARNYKRQAQHIREGGGVLFPSDEIEPGDGRSLVHPPGYSLFMAGVFSIWGDSNAAVRLVQIVGDGLSAVAIFLIALELLNLATATIAGLLIALSPHLAFYSLWLSADSISVLPILAAVYLAVKSVKRPALTTVIAAGAMIGVSCWIRANALMLAPFLAAAVAISLDRGKRLWHGLALVGAAVVVIAPITIRNQIVFHRFVPLSIAGGENLVVGIADFDKEGRFGMPASDCDAGIKDAEWHNRPDYAKSPWVPDGIDRDHYRYARGFEVIRSHPLWFAGVMIRRAAFMLSYNSPGRADWPFDTSRAPIVSIEPGAVHSAATIPEARPVWSSSPRELQGGGRALSDHAELWLDTASQTLQIAGDDTEFGDQFASAPIAVKPATDYVINLRMTSERGRIAAKVAGRDLHVTLASAIVEGSLDDSAAREQNLVQMEFASGDRHEVRLIISNNGRASSLRVGQIGQATLFELGPTPYWWTRYPRTLIRVIQKSLYKTNVMLPLVIAGAMLLYLGGRRRALVVLLAVPAYYLCFQSALSTEYRYILAIHYFLFVMSAAALCSTGLAMARLSLRLKARTWPKGLQPTGERARIGAAESN